MKQNQKKIIKALPGGTLGTFYNPLLLSLLTPLPLINRFLGVNRNPKTGVNLKLLGMEGMPSASSDTPKKGTQKQSRKSPQVVAEVQQPETQQEVQQTTQSMNWPLFVTKQYTSPYQQRLQNTYLDFHKNASDFLKRQSWFRPVIAKKGGRLISKAQWGTMLQQQQNQTMQDISQFLNRSVNTAKEVNNNLQRKREVQAKQMKRKGMLNKVAELQDALWKIGAFKGVKNRKGKELTYNQAVDGIFKGLSEQALKNAQTMGYTIDRQKGTVTKNKTTNSTAAQPKDKSTNNDGHAIYLHYPNFRGSFENAVKIGNIDIGSIAKRVSGKDKIPVGHAASILVDTDGNATYYEYGRYPGNDSHVFGNEKRSTKGGNWRKFQLPKQLLNENDSVYLTRIQHLLPDTETGTYQAISFPEVDVNTAQKWIQQQADDSKRSEYNIMNTCATGACNSILPFANITEKTISQGDNTKGYSEDAQKWSKLPLSTGKYAKKMRMLGSRVYIMN